MSNIKKAYFHPSWVALNREIRKDKKLVESLRKLKVRDIESVLGEVAAYLGLVLDGEFSPNEIIGLSELLLELLRSKNAIIFH